MLLLRFYLMLGFDNTYRMAISEFELDEVRDLRRTLRIDAATGGHDSQLVHFFISRISERLITDANIAHAQNSQHFTPASPYPSRLSMHVHISCTLLILNTTIHFKAEFPSYEARGTTNLQGLPFQVQSTTNDRHFYKICRLEWVLSQRYSTP